MLQRKHHNHLWLLASFSLLAGITEAATTPPPPPTVRDNTKTTLDPFDCHSLPLPSTTQKLNLSPAHFPLTHTNLEQTPPSETRTSIQIDLCNPLPIDAAIPARDQCPQGTRVCILVESIKDGKTVTTQAIPVAFSDRDEGKTIKAQVKRDDQEGRQGVKVYLDGGRYADRQQRTEIHILCDPKADANALPTSQRYHRDKGELELIWPTKFACSSSSSSPSSPSGGNDGKLTPESGGWGFFSSLLFLILLGFGVYMAAGMWRNYNHYGASGWDLVPNRDFWREAPYIARDAVSHAWRSVAGSGAYGGGGLGGGGGGGGGRGAYEPL